MRGSPLFMIGAVLCLIPLKAQVRFPHFSGQWWGGGAYGSDPADGFDPYELSTGYIPSLSMQLPSFFGAEILAEWSIRWGSSASRDTTGEWTVTDTRDHYRMWVNLAGDQWEFRLGRQKIAYGPGQLLRPLAWYDTFDLRDPTGQTVGVDAARLRLFFSGGRTLWTWASRPASSTDDWTIDSFAPGGRLELPFGAFDLGITASHRSNTDVSAAGQILTHLPGPESRLAFDFRTDQFVGLWAEGVLAFGGKEQYFPEQARMFMAGLDYTLPIGNGLLIMFEHLQARYMGNGEMIPLQQEATAIIISVPVSILDRAMVVMQVDHQNNNTFRFLLWQRTYDHLGLNAIIFANPSRSDLGIDASMLPNSLVGLGTGAQLLFVYHH